MSESASLPVNFGGLDERRAGFDGASVLIWPVPLEKTVSYGGGTQDGPDVIIDASRNMELYDDELDREVADIGIHTLPAFDVPDGIDRAIQSLADDAGALLESGKFLCTLGGEHSITPPLVRAHLARFPSLTVLQIDAHADLRDRYDATPHSHASAMRRVTEMCPAVQVGIRSLSLEEARAIPRLPVRVFYARDIVGRTDWIPDVVHALGEHVYLTVDVDGFDPSLVPTTGTPEPGGLSWYEVTSLLKAVASHRKIVGMDVVELSSPNGNAAPGFLVAKLIYKTLGYIFSP